MFKCGVSLSLGDVPVTRITSTVSVPPSEELQEEQSKLISAAAFITFIQVFKNSIKNYCRTIPNKLKIYIMEFFCFKNLFLSYRCFINKYQTLSRSNTSSV